MSDILRKARSFIEDRKNWTRYALAKGKDKQGINPTDPRAKTFCVLGAFKKAYGNPNLEVYTCRYPNEDKIPKELLYLDKAADRVSKGAKPHSINDNLGYAKTMEMLDLAICMRDCDMEKENEPTTKS